ncbi:MAG: Tyrosine-specific transport protein [Chlamydiae bacterium]|nr:Tyrosine-specific transport protein [Chlamydiota bacterium]
MAKPSLTGSIFLIAGSCIGAGMLGLPIVSGQSGFVPSTISFVIAWAFMLIAGLLFLEVNLRFGSHISFISMAEKTLGPIGKAICWIFFLFLFYALTVAYISGTSSLLVSFFEKEAGLKLSNTFLSVVFTVLFACVIYLGTKEVVSFNRYLVLGLFVFFVLLIVFSVTHVQAKNLSYMKWEKSVFALPVMMIAFGFHNMIPSLVDYFKGSRKKMIITLVAGSLLAFGIYFVWQFVVLGIVPVEGKFGILDNIKNDREGAQAIIYILQNKWIGIFSWGLGFFALTTSFLAQGLSLVDFYADGLKINKRQGKNSLALVLLALFPPLVFAIVYPNIFLKALGFGGGICAMILFGILPPLMCLKSRQQKKDYQVFGGKGLLFLMMLFALFVIIIELFTELTR